MTGEAKTVETRVAIGEERRDALLSALRRGAGGEALALLDGWHSRMWRDLDDIEDDEEAAPAFSRRQRDLTDWVRDERRLHVAAGRFQHALALLDRYLLLPQLFTAAADRARIQRIRF